MSLSEPQIQRFARQILLRGVGGKGQEKLLARPIRVVGSSPALEVAVTYLLAGGTPLTAAAPAAFVASAEISALSERPIVEQPAFLELVAEPHLPAMDAVRVFGAGVVVQTATTCHACVALLAQRAAEPWWATTVGAMAALMVQRRVLELPTVGRCEFQQGRWDMRADGACEHQK